MPRAEPGLAAGAGDDGRDESPAERADRNWSEILQELRAVQTGTQILTGFLLAIAFQPAFGELPAPERVAYLCLVVGSAAATLLALAPVIMHRVLFRRRQKERLARIGSACLIVLLAVVSLLVAGVTAFLFDVTVDRTAGAIALVVALVVVAATWLVVPRLGRRAAG